MLKVPTSLLISTFTGGDNPAARGFIHRLDKKGLNLYYALALIKQIACAG